MSSGRTLYHVVFAQLLKERAPPNVRVIAEFQLATEPQQADFLVLRQEGERRDAEAQTLVGMWGLIHGTDLLGEYKSPVRPHRFGDFGKLLGYGGQYWSMEAERLGDQSNLTLGFMPASWTPSLHRELDALHLRATALGGGYYDVDTRPFRAIIAVIDEVAEAERDELLQLVGHRRMHTDEQDRWLIMHTAYGPEAKEMEKLEGYDELLVQALARMPPHVRVQGLTPQQRVEGMTPDEVMATLLLKLSDEDLRQLPRALVDRQPPQIRDEIRRRLQTH
jgi:hypothetical protein